VDFTNFAKEVCFTLMTSTSGSDKQQ